MHNRYSPIRAYQLQQRERGLPCLPQPSVVFRHRMRTHREKCFCRRKISQGWSRLNCYPYWSSGDHAGLWWIIKPCNDLLISVCLCAMPYLETKYFFNFEWEVQPGERLLDNCIPLHMSVYQSQTSICFSSTGARLEVKILKSCVHGSRRGRKAALGEHRDIPPRLHVDIAHTSISHILYFFSPRLSPPLTTPSHTF